QNIPKDDRHELIKCKEHLKSAESRREELDLRINANRAALQVLKKKGEKNMDRMLDALENAGSVWNDVISQAPLTQNNLVPLTKLWTEKTEEEVEAYQAKVTEQREAFKDLLFWSSDSQPEGGRKALQVA
ncbi:unnamed protein product, partial [Discosporangium mesarthrocarpum]